jgi:hypothetical protein
MIDYMVRNTLWNEYIVCSDLEAAKAHIAKELGWDPSAKASDFVIFKRERIEHDF